MTSGRSPLDHTGYPRKLPDGTVIWTSPTGHTYTTYPGSTAAVPDPVRSPPPRCGLATHPPPKPTDDRGVMMPKRRNTRAHNTAKAITAERRLNDAHVAERNKPPPF